MVKPGEIYLIEKAKLRSCRDARPCVVLNVSDGRARIYLFSSQFDCADGSEVTLLKTDPEFPASGLRKDSYVVGRGEVDVAIGVFSSARFLGHATGEFKRKIEALYGAPLK